MARRARQHSTHRPSYATQQREQSGAPQAEQAVAGSAPQRQDSKA